jgi:hypothetical protein
MYNTGWREDVLGRGIYVQWERSSIAYCFSQRGLRTPLSTKRLETATPRYGNSLDWIHFCTKACSLLVLLLEFWPANFLHRRAIAFLAAKFRQCCSALTPFRARVLQPVFVRHDWSWPIPVVEWSKAQLPTFRKNTVASPSASRSATDFGTTHVRCWPRRGGNFSNSDVKRVI